VRESSSRIQKHGQIEVRVCSDGRACAVMVALSCSTLSCTRTSEERDGGHDASLPMADGSGALFLNLQHRGGSGEARWGNGEGQRGSGEGQAAGRGGRGSRTLACTPCVPCHLHVCTRAMHAVPRVEVRT
jgi:hypothetical protein